MAPKTKATPAVNPKTSRAGPGGRCYRLNVFDSSEFQEVIPKLLLICCATGEVYGQLLDSLIGMTRLSTLNRRG